MHSDRIEVDVDGGAADGWVFAPAGEGPWPLVVMYMDAGGLRPPFAAMGERLARHGYVVLQPNLYWRSGAYEPLDPKVMFSDPAQRERVRALMRGVHAAEVQSDTLCFLERLSSDSLVRDTRQIGVLGYCMGGRQAFLAACAWGDRVVAAAAIHPGGLVTDGPDSPHLRVSGLRASVYVGAADADGSFTSDQQETLRTALAGAEVPYEVELCRGARHGYAMTDFPVFDAPAAEHHWIKVLDLFGATLGRS